MLPKPLVTISLCVGLFLILQALLPKAMAMRNPSNVERFMTEGHRTHKTKNYMMQRARDNEIMGSNENRDGVTYEVEPYDPDRNPEELSAFIVDYANMIRNDVILLDKSVETRTRKRGNIKVKKYNSQVLSELPWNCTPNVINETLAGLIVFPRIIQIKNCSSSKSCKEPLQCKNIFYNILIMKWKPTELRDPNQPYLDEQLPKNLQSNWYTEVKTISVGCTCTPKYASTD